MQDGWVLSETADLAARLEREMAAIGGRATPKRLAEVVAGLCGWVPRGG